MNTKIMFSWKIIKVLYLSPHQSTAQEPLSRHPPLTLGLTQAQGAGCYPTLVELYCCLDNPDFPGVFAPSTLCPRRPLAAAEPTTPPVLLLGLLWVTPRAAPAY